MTGATFCRVDLRTRLHQTAWDIAALADNTTQSAVYAFFG